MTDLVNLTINGRKASVAKGTLLVEAARQIGIEIPIFCYHPKLKPVGACRMCLVEIEKMPRLQTACTTPVSEGMVVQTASKNAAQAQQGVLELLLANHPLDCPICDKGGECPLQDNTFKYGPGVSRMTEEKRVKDKAYPLSDKIALDQERCILCYRCTRFQAEIPGDSALVALDRGGTSEIGTLSGESFDSPFSGNTIELCPVGALTSRYYRFRARPWDLKHTPSVCAGCAVGCNVSLHARDGAILRVLARENPQVDDGWLCDQGRFATLPAAGAPARPQLRRDGKLVPVSWDEALQHATAMLRRQAAVLAAPTLSNEGFQALGALRQALPEAAFGILPRAHSPWLVQGRIHHLARCTKIVNLGLDPWTDLPVLALWQRKPLAQGAALVAVGPRNGLWRDSAAWLQGESAQVPQLLRELLAALDGAPAKDQVARAAARLAQDGPAAVLLARELAEDAATLQLAQQLAAKLGANAETGLVGAPALGANARGAQQIVPEITQGQPRLGDAMCALVFGLDEVPAGPHTLLVASARAVPADPRIELLLPLAHPYETAGTYLNFAGLAQPLAPGGFRQQGVLQDHVLLGRLHQALTKNLSTSR